MNCHVAEPPASDLTRTLKTVVSHDNDCPRALVGLRTSPFHKRQCDFPGLLICWQIHSRPGMILLRRGRLLIAFNVQRARVTSWPAFRAKRGAAGKSSCLASDRLVLGDVPDGRRLLQHTGLSAVD